jgi:hypothetical protein
MPDTKPSVQPGGWIRIPRLFPGVWKVSRIIANFKESRWFLDQPSVISSRTLVFCHRLTNDSWKRSFSYASCELSYVTKLAPADVKQIDALLASDPKLRKAFEKYQNSGKTLDLIANLAFGGFSNPEIEQFSNICNEMLASRIDEGITLDEVLMLLQSRGLDSHMRTYPLQRTLQLASVGHELRGAEFIYRNFRTLSS